MRQLAVRLAKAQGPERDRLQAGAMEAIGPMLGRMGMMERHLMEISPEQLSPDVRPTTLAAPTQPTSQATTQSNQAAVQVFLRFRDTLIALRERKFDAESRKRLRDIVQQYLGPFEYARLLQSQIAYFQTDNTGASFDSELSLLWWEYPKTGWMANPLHYSASVAKTPPVMMVSRLDGPQTGIVKQIIETSLKAETEGLKGRIVIDSRGLPAEKAGKPEPYGQYDQSLRNLAELVQTKTKLSSLFDDRPEVLPAGSAKKCRGVRRLV